MADTRMGPKSELVTEPRQEFPIGQYLCIQIDENLARTGLRHIQLDHFGGHGSRLIIDASLLLLGDFRRGHID